MKKIIALVLALVLCTSMVAFAANDVSVELDGKAIPFDQPPIIDNGRTLVPLRAIFEALGAEVEYVQDMKTIISKKGDLIIVMQIGLDKMWVNGVEKALDVPAKIVGGRTLVPVRAISESMGVDVNWDKTTRTVKLFNK